VGLAAPPGIWLCKSQGIRTIFYEKDGKRREEGRGGDKEKAEEQPAVEPVAVGGQGVEVRQIATSPVQDMSVNLQLFLYSFFHATSTIILSRYFGTTYVSF
jgi:hypothetical protein